MKTISKLFKRLFCFRKPDTFVRNVHAARKQDDQSVWACSKCGAERRRPYIYYPTNAN